MVGAVVNCPGHVSQYSSPLCSVSRHPYGAQVSVDLRLGTFEQLGSVAGSVMSDRRMTGRG